MVSLLIVPYLGMKRQVLVVTALHDSMTRTSLFMNEVNRQSAYRHGKCTYWYYKQIAFVYS